MKKKENYIREKSTRDEISALANAEEKGIEKGIKQEKISIAQNMLNSGLDNNMISSITGLSVEEIEKLK